MERLNYCLLQGFSHFVLRKQLIDYLVFGPVIIVMFTSHSWQSCKHQVFGECFVMNWTAYITMNKVSKMFCIFVVEF